MIIAVSFDSVMGLFSFADIRISAFLTVFSYTNSWIGPIIHLTYSFVLEFRILLSLNPPNSEENFLINIESITFKTYYLVHENHTVRKEKKNG